MARSRPVTASHGQSRSVTAGLGRIHVPLPGEARKEGIEIEAKSLFVVDARSAAGRLTDGKVTEIRAVSDRLGLFAQLGWDWPS